MSHRECFDPFSLGSATRNSPPSLQTLPFARWPPFWAARVRLPCRPRPRRSGRRAHPGTAEGGRLPGHGLFGIGRLRAPAEKPHRRHLAARDRPARPDRRPVDNPALYRLPRSLNALRCIQEADPKNSCPTKREGRTTRGSSGLPLAFGPFCHISGAKARRQARPSFLGQGTLRQSSRVISWHSSRVRRNSSLI